MHVGLCTMHDLLFTAVNKKRGTNNHILEKEDKRRRCTGCYNNLRLTLSSIEAGKKVKKVPTICRQCNKHLCLPCFNIEHKNNTFL